MGFGISGKTLVPFDLTPNGTDTVAALAEQSNGKLLLGGAAFTSPASIDAVVVRLNGNGSPDSEFGTLGKKTLDFGVFIPSVQLLYGLAFQGMQLIAAGVVAVAADSTGDNIVVRLKNDLIFAPVSVGGANSNAHELEQSQHVERPVEFAPVIVVAQHRHALAVTRFEHLVAVDKHTVEIRHTRPREHVEGEIAQVAVVALIQDQGAWKGHRCVNRPQLRRNQT